MAMLLTDTYLAFNLADEDAAFDQLARNLSVDLVPVVYLDSRRRLTAGTRQGAGGHCKGRGARDVGRSRSSLGESSAASWTFPCKWL